MKRTLQHHSADTMYSNTREEIYRYDDYQLIFNTKGCTNTKKGRLLHVNNAFVRRDSEEVTTALENIIPRVVTNCPEITSIVVGYPKGGFETFSVKEGFLSKRQKLKIYQERRNYEAQGRDKRQEEDNENFPRENPLKQRGYYASVQVYKGKNYRVFLGWHKPHPRAVNSRKIIFVHNIGENELIYKMPINITEFQQVLDSINLTGVDWTRIHHYVEGYHHPMDDRRAVMVPYKEETPLVIFGVNGHIPAHQTKPQIVSIEVFDNHNGALQATSLGVVDAVVSVAEAKEKFIKGQNIKNEFLSKNGPSDQYLENERVARERAISKGYIYKNAHYWSDFNNHDLGQIFSGVRSGLKIKSPILVAYVQAFIKNKSALCPDTIDANHAIFSFSKQTTYKDPYGNIKNQSIEDMGQVKVDRRFIPIFSLYSGAEPDNISSEETRKMIGMLFGLHGQEGKNLLFEHYKFTYELLKSSSEDIRMLFEREECNSPVLRQLEENLYRYATNQKPIQESTARIEGAIRVTDELPNTTSRTIAQACLSMNDYGSHYLGFCNCLGKKITALVTPSQVEDFSMNYNKFRSYLTEIEQTIGYGEKHPDIKLYYADQSCRQ